ncbi:MAG TPA: zinc-dependent metalloprotease [Mycobacteriales bacterium]|nr:zinc-dependent metalloprotease [Mycobacteriales bacterium]
MQLVDWQVAAATATRLVPPGPRLALDDAVATVAELRTLAAEADVHVAAFTGLTGAGAGGAPVAVVDRPGWIRSNVDGFRDLLDPLLDSLSSTRSAPLGPITSAIGPRVTGAEVGALLAYLATRVLGQFELLGPAPVDGMPGGRLTLVAPNIVATERALDVPSRDFRLWVCLHEVTHRTQFAAAPWLHEHVRALLRDYLTAADLDPAAILSRLRGALGSLSDVVRGRSDLSFIELVQTPEQRAVLDRVTGLMSLLEGHADVVMDGVGPTVVPSVARIRERFEGRRRSGNPVERMLRRLFGIEMKMKQYAEGARFVRGVVDRVGMAGLNRVWDAPELLPDAAEIRDPVQWLARVHPEPVPAVNG